MEKIKKHMFTARLDKETVARASRLAKALARDPQYQAFRMSRTAAFRLCLERGLLELEREYLLLRPTATEGGV